MSEADWVGQLLPLGARVARLLRRRWPLVVGVTALVPALVAARMALLAPQYEGLALMQVGMHADVIDPDGPLSGAPLAAGMASKTHLRLLETDGVALRALEVYEGKPRPADHARAEALEAFRDAVRIQPIKGTFLIEVRGRDVDPARAARLCNSVLDAFVPFSNEFFGARYVVQAERLREREARCQAELKTAEDRLVALQREHGAIRFEDRRAALAARQQGLLRRVTELQVTRSTLDAERHRIERLRGADGITLEELAGGAIDPDARGATRAPLERVVELRGRLAQLAASLKEGHPAYAALQADLAAEELSTRAALLEQLGVRAARLEQSGEVAAADAATVTTHLAALDAEVVALERLEGEVRATEREVAWFDRELESVREQARRASSQGDGDRAATVVLRAEPPLDPVRRFTVTVGLLSAALGLAGVTLVLLARERLLDVVTAEEALAELELPALARLPELPAGAAGDELAAVRAAATGAGPLADALRVLRANLATKAPGQRALIVSSASAGEGKSFVALSLAAVLARGGARVALVEADLRRPRLSTILAVEHRPGLAELLAGKATLAEAIAPSGIERVDLVPSGAAAQAPGDLLVGGRFPAVVAELAASHDHVVIDTPPLVGLADAGVMARCAAVLLVVRLGTSRRGAVVAALEQLRNAGAQCPGVVYNAAPTDALGYGYGYEPPTAAAPS